MLLTMSPGLVAVPLGMFSTAGTTTVKLIGSFNLVIAAIVPMTLAAPHMSNFISSMLGPGLSEIPPVSNVTPLPTSTTGLLLPAPLYCMTMSFAGSTAPAVTDNNEPMPRRFISVSVTMRVVSLPLPLASFFATRAR